MTVLDKIHNICSMKILHGNFKLGGRGRTVGIDDSMFGNKWKYNHGCVSEGQWVFGVADRDTGRSLFFRVPDREQETLATRLVREFFQTGTVIISDKFSPYFNLSDTRLHPPDDQPLGKLCWLLHWSTQQHHSGPLESSKTEAEGDEWNDETKTTRVPWRL